MVLYPVRQSDQEVFLESAGYQHAASANQYPHSLIPGIRRSLHLEAGDLPNQNVDAFLVLAAYVVHLGYRDIDLLRP